MQATLRSWSGRGIDSVAEPRGLKCQDAHLAGLGVHNLSAAVLGALGQRNNVILAQVSLGGCLQQIQKPYTVI